MRRTIGSLAISGLVGACFTSAIVLAQAGGGAPAQAPATAQAKPVEGPLRIIEGKLESPFDEPKVAQDKKGRRAADQKAVEAAAAEAVPANGRIRAVVIKGRSRRRRIAHP